MIHVGDGKEHVIMHNYMTEDIISLILQADKINAPYTLEFSKGLEFSNREDLLSFLWHFVKDHIHYKEDGDHEQVIKSAGEVWRTRVADCKSMSLFIGSVLQNLGIPYSYRFISQSRDADLHHVYIVVKEDGNLISCDPVHDEFNREMDFVRYEDYKGFVLEGAKVSGAKVGTLYGSDPYNHIPNFNLKNATGNTYKQLYENHMKAYKANIYSIGGLTGTHFQKIVQDIAAHFPNQPIKKKAALETFGAFIKIAHICVYAYDKDCGFSFEENLGTNWQSIITKMGGTLGSKRSKAIDMINTLRDECGVKPYDMRWIVDYSCYGQYGVSAQLLLEKLINSIKYGTEFGAKPGVPFYNNVNKSWETNGANAADVLFMMSCFMATEDDSDYPTLPPVGQPYWSKAGRIISNGASNNRLELFIKNNPMPTWLYSKFTWRDLSEENFQRGFNFFKEWLDGNVALQPPPTGKIGFKPQIGEIATAAIIAIITAVLSFIATITVAILQTKAKAEALANAKDGANLPINDGNIPFETQGGCVIFHKDGKTFKQCPGGVPIELSEIDLLRPENQPSSGMQNPNDDLPFLSTNSWVCVAGAAVVGYVLLNDEK